MTEEKLNKMRWLHEQGFEPDMLDVGAGMLVSYDEELKFINKEDLEPPYFTESKLWSLLPATIRRREEHETLTGEFSTSNVFYELVIEKYRKKTSIAYSVPVDQRESLDCLIEFESDDLHDALLDMVIWCCENKYLKAEEK
jgi:hypothetical protein